LLVFLKFIAAIAMLAGLHVGTMAALGRCLGIKVRRISLGFGPSLFSLGIFQLRLLPIAGSIAFKDTRTEDVPDDVPAGHFDDVFNHKRRAIRVLLPLAGRFARAGRAALWLWVGLALSWLVAIGFFAVQCRG
jgi:membrane-associated protease RseP (regulator of RpoE activity)